MSKIKYPHLFEPLTVRGKTFKNRFFSAPNDNAFIEEGKPITFKVNTKAVEIKPNGVEVEVNGEKSFIEADTVLYSVGLKGCGNALADQLRHLAYETVVLGDAKQSRKIYEAINEAYNAAMDIGNL